jgi:hypothetical protein
MGILSKNTSETWILPHLTVGSRGFDPTAPVIEIVEAISYRLKTACQWREIPTKEFLVIQFLAGIRYFITLINGLGIPVKGRLLD